LLLVVYLTKNFMNKPNVTGSGMRKPKIAGYSLGAAFLFTASLLLSGGSLAAQTLYSIGDPSDDEQVYVELINRARSNPNAEAQRMKNITDANVLSAYSYFGVNLDLMVTQFALLSVAPPLSINTALTTAARLHSQDMLTYGYQGHVDHNGSTLAQRLTAQGYSYTSAAENVGAYTFYPLYGHAGMEVDWGGNASTGGMQSPAGHRLNIHNAALREIGIGVVNGTNSSVSPPVGPQLVTQDFGVQTTVPYITGVAYYDFNSNGFYDTGEGIGGVTVTVAGQGYYATTSTSGGYSVPVSGNGTYTVTFSAPNLANASYQATVSGGNSVKLDYTPAYSAPVISVPGTAVAGQAAAYTFTSVGGATGYDWKRDTLVPFTAADGAESGLAYMTANISAGYSAVVTDSVHTGGAAFHLAHVQPTDQSLTWNHTVRPSANSVLTFWSRLGYATSAQTAVVQLSSDGGAHWLDVWAVAGSNNSGQASFFQQNVSLGIYAGMNLQIRFLYRFGTGNYYPQSSTGIGFYIDDISVSNAQELTSSTISAAGNSTFSFTPPATGTYALSVRAKLPGRTLSWGPSTIVPVNTVTQNPNPTPSDLNGDGHPDLLWQSGGYVVAWLMNGTSISSTNVLATNASGWQVEAIGDLNGDGQQDIILQNGGYVLAWLMNGTTVTGSTVLSTSASGWQVKAIADLNGDGQNDIIWQSGGYVVAWLMNGTSISSTATISTGVSGWQLKAVADLNGDGHPDFIWQNGNYVVAWLMNGTSISSTVMLSTNAGGWQVKAIADLNGDGHPDIIWQNNGYVVVWLMSSPTVISTVTVLSTNASGWNVVGAK
jgi:hypothetical protein